METKKINVAGILAGKPLGLKLWSPAFGRCEFKGVITDGRTKESLISIDAGGDGYCLFDDGRFSKQGVCVLFPSEDMCDWSKFAWKKGDVLASYDGTCECVFDGWYNESYTQIRARHWLNSKDENNIKYLSENQPLTELMTLEDEELRECYINTINERLGGKLNMVTLEIERPAFTLRNLYVFKEIEDDGQTTIGELIGKNEDRDTLTFGDQLDVETGNYVTSEAFDLSVSLHKELRPATEEERKLFESARERWGKGRKEAARTFKPFERVLVRDKDTDTWEIALYVKPYEGTKGFNHFALSLEDGICDGWVQCIPYEGHEHLAFTNFHEDTLPF